MSAADGLPRPVFPSLEAAWEDWARTAGEGGTSLSEEDRQDLKPVFLYGATAVWAMVQTMPKDRAACAAALDNLGLEITKFCDEAEAHLLDSGTTTRH